MFDAQTETTNSTPAPTSPPVAPTSAQPDYPFRLLPDETVLAFWPLVQAKMRLGKIASYVFVTDSRLIYSAEAKSIVSSSTHHREFQISTIKGLDVNRHRGLSDVGFAAVIGSALTFVGLILLTIIFAALDQDFTRLLAVLTGVLAVGAVIAGIFNLTMLRTSDTLLLVNGPEGTTHLAGQGRTTNAMEMLMLLAVFGPFISIAQLLISRAGAWGIVRATDAAQFASAESVDRISYEAGALILDIQARGKLVGKA